MHASAQRLSVLAATGMVSLMVFALLPGAAVASPVPATAVASGSWAYGAVKTVSVGPLMGDNGWTYQGNATFGYTVTIFENNTSASTFELTVFRTMGAAFSVQFCLPSCSAPTEWVNESYRAWESTTAFSNFTTQGSVVEGSSSVPAIGILNSTAFLRENVTESSDVFLPHAGQLGPHTNFLSASISGESAVTFAPALGLIPLNLSPGSSWSSTSQYNESGSAQRSYYFAAHTPLKNTILGPYSGAVSFGSNGSISLEGLYAAGSTIAFGGVTYPAITITIIGPFSVREGVIFVPSVADLFGSSTQPWNNDQNGTASAAMSTLDVKATADDHLALAASSWRFTSDSANAAEVSPPSSSGIATAVATSNPVSSTTLQGEPETTAQSSSSSGCLTTGNGCPTVAAGPLPRAWLGVIVVAGAVATVGALLALAVVSRRRSVPPPAYPNAVLYPPGSTNPAAPSGTRAPPGTPPPPEDDPLNHLW